MVLAASVLTLSFAAPAFQSRGLWPDIPCLFNRLTGLPCLTCGLSRSFILTARLDPAGALEMHPLGPALFIALALFTVYLAASLAVGFRVRVVPTRRLKRLAFWSAAGLFIVSWVVKVATTGLYH